MGRCQGFNPPTNESGESIHLGQKPAKKCPAAKAEKQQQLIGGRSSVLTGEGGVSLEGRHAMSSSSGEGRPELKGTD